MESDRGGNLDIYKEMGRELGAYAKSHKVITSAFAVYVGLILLGAGSMCNDAINPSSQKDENDSTDFVPETPEYPGNLELPLESGQVVTIGKTFII